MPWGGFKPLHLGAASSDGDHYTICCSFCTLISVDVVNWDNNLKILLLSECAKIKQTQWLAIIGPVRTGSFEQCTNNAERFRKSFVSYSVQKCFFS